MAYLKYFIYPLLIVGVIWLLFLSGGNNYVTSGRFDEYSEEVSDPVHTITSNNWECTEDCSGHEAGYEWASVHDITDPEDCGGNSDSFIEGCQAYANETSHEIDESNQGYYDNYSY
jgi:hypothetical protein